MPCSLPEREPSLSAASTTDLLRTPLFDLHQELGARMVPFAGYSMPVQYPMGVMKEHLHTRAAAGLFLAFQYPVEIPGVGNMTFLRTALNAQRKARGEEELSAGDFLKLVREKAKALELKLAELLRFGEDNDVISTRVHALSIALMGLAASFIAKLLNKHRWIAYVGLVVIVYVAFKMIWEGFNEVAPIVQPMVGM